MTKENYIQCLNCGKIYTIPKRIGIDVLYINVMDYPCPCCDNYKGLNVGKDLTDIYFFYDSNLDYRYLQGKDNTI